MSSVGTPSNRADGPLKVCGLARYTADVTLPRMAHAVMVQSAAPNGRIARIDGVAAERSPGVLLVLTHLNAMRLPEGGRAAVQPPQGRVLSLLQDDQVHYVGQPVALVIAETPEQALHACSQLRVDIAPEPPVLDFGQAMKGAYSPGKIQDQPADSTRGAPLAALKDAAPLHYATPMQHHNPMEPHATLATWDGERLTVHDATQYAAGVRRTLAKTFGIAPERVRVVCPFVGGAFGGKGSAWSHVVLAAMAARQLGRPVRLVLQRPQLFGPVGGRPRTEQQLRLAADAQGRLLAVEHRSFSSTSAIEDWTEPSAVMTRTLYACANLETQHRLVKMNIGTPTFQRAPGEATGSFALESALDELAHQHRIDPLELRLRNHADRDPESGKPFSSKSLRECYRVGAQRFGWSRRNATPGAAAQGPWRIGFGMASATRPAKRMPCKAVARWLPEGRVVVQSSTAELGTGTYTVMAQVAADALGLPLERVRFELGDTAMPEAPISAGSMTMESVGSAVHAACTELKRKLEAAGRRDQPMEAEGESRAGEEAQRFSMHSFGAVFVEARVDRDLGLVRVPRVVGAFAVGRVINPKTARSQLMGGIVWGLSQALMEASVLDTRHGRFANANLAEYHVPVNADIGDIEVLFVPEHDEQVNPLGAKGLGEVGMVGVAAAVANAVFNATGRRIRELPITLDKLMP